MASNNGGPWGGSGSDGGDDGGHRPGGERPQIPEIDQLMKKGQEQLRVLMGGRGGRGGRGAGSHGEGPKFTRGTVGLVALAAVGLWVFMSFYTVKPEQESVELLLGKYYKIGTPGLNFAPWPVVTKQILQVTGERTEDIGVGSGSGGDKGLMLTHDKNIVNIDFQVVWNISDPAKFLFNLRDPAPTVRAVAESAMRGIIAQSDLAPVLNKDRGIIAAKLSETIQKTLGSYDSGINIVRVNFDRADPPKEVIDSFRQVQAAGQERDRLQRQADAYSNTVVAAARGEAAQVLQQAEGYRAQVVNQAEGDASRFTSILKEYKLAPAVTRKRLYLETIAKVLGSVKKVIVDQGVSGSGVVPYLPLSALAPGTTSKTPTKGGTK